MPTTPRLARVVTVDRWDAGTLGAHLDDLVAVYREAFLEVFEDDPERAEAERRPTIERHLRTGGVRGVAAVERECLLGFGYGYHGAPGQWWHDVVRSALDPAEADRWLGDCFEVVELHVRPRAQGRGLGRRLLHELLATATERTSALSALDDPELPARRLYAAEGFRPLLTGFRFPGGTKPFAVLVRDLR